jgi:hypothetical protein
MTGLAVTLVLLAVPAGHQVWSHRVLQRGHAPTAHELAHQSRPTWLRVLADVGWLVFLALTLAVALALRLPENFPADSSHRSWHRVGLP